MHPRLSIILPRKGRREGGSGAVFSLLCGYLFNKMGKSFSFLGEKS